MNQCRRRTTIFLTPKANHLYLSTYIFRYTQNITLLCLLIYQRHAIPFRDEFFHPLNWMLVNGGTGGGLSLYFLYCLSLLFNTHLLCSAPLILIFYSISVQLFLIYYNLIYLIWSSFSHPIHFIWTDLLRSAHFDLIWINPIQSDSIRSNPIQSDLIFSLLFDPITMLWYDYL